MQSMSMDHIVECKYKYDVICPGNAWYKTVTTVIKGNKKKKNTMTYFGQLYNWHFSLILGIWGSWEFENLRILGSEGIISAVLGFLRIWLTCLSLFHHLYCCPPAEYQLLQVVMLCHMTREMFSFTLVWIKRL